MSANTVTSLEPLRIAHVINEPFGAESANGVQQVVYCLANALADELLARTPERTE